MPVFSEIANQLDFFLSSYLWRLLVEIWSM